MTTLLASMASVLLPDAAHCHVSIAATVNLSSPSPSPPPYPVLSSSKLSKLSKLSGLSQVIERIGRNRNRNRSSGTSIKKGSFCCTGPHALPIQSSCSSPAPTSVVSSPLLSSPQSTGNRQLEGPKAILGRGCIDHGSVPPNAFDPKPPVQIRSLLRMQIHGVQLPCAKPTPRMQHVANCTYIAILHPSSMHPQGILKRLS
ncbi:hypothetical protein BJ546DRAFT_954638 [Cryomyces antarcticus]